MKVFSRARIGLRKPTGPYGQNPDPTFASIHHAGAVGGPPLTFKSAAAKWRSYQDWHQSQGWTDIGYHVGIDGLGRLYAGRPVSAVPAAVGGHNTASVGIVFMQDGGQYRLNALQRRTLRLLFEKGEPVLGIPPLKNLRGGVKGHREFSGHLSNACPGDHILRHLKWRRGKY